MKRTPKPPMSKPWLIVPMMATLLVSSGSAALAAKGSRAGSQLQFGIEMAKRGLWNEALFRFERVLEEQPNNARVLNNIAVAYEATGRFDDALDHYKRALAVDSSNRDLRRNYAQFLEFYQGLRPKADEDEKEAAAGDGARVSDDEDSEEEPGAD